MKHYRLYPRLYRTDYLTLTGLREVLTDELGKLSGSVVDYGCGSQPYRTLIPSACRYIGADFSTAGEDIVVLDSTGKLPLPDASADNLLSTQVLEHVEDVADYLHECRRVLRPGGKLLLTTHGNWPYHPNLPHVKDYWRWTAPGLERLVETNGFRVLAVRPSCEGKLSLIQQLLALHDPARVKRSFWRRCARAGWALGWNALAVTLTDIAPRWMRSGDILAVDFLVVAEKV